MSSLQQLVDNPIPWPSGYRCAVAFTFDMDAESGLHLNFPDTAHRRIAMSSMLRYGPEVAIPRLMRVFQHYDMQQTFFIPGWCVENYPQAIKTLVDHGHEIAHHGYLHERTNELSEVDERRVLDRGVRAIEKMTGERPTGYRAPSYAFSDHTLEHLIGLGFAYDSSLLGADVPYELSNGTEKIVEIPVDMTLDDWTQYVCIKEFGNVLPIASPERAMEVFRAEFDAVWQHGGMWISVWHPFVSGRLARTDAMVELIDYMQEKGGVWFTTCQAISEHVRRCIDAGQWQPRVDRLPYYDGPIST